MDFLNEQIPSFSMPEVQDVMWQPVEKDHLKVLRLQWLIVSALFLLIIVSLLLFINELQYPLWIILLPAGWIIISWLYFILQEKSFRSLAYCIREHDILYRRGWIIQKIMACPFNRIQHCTVDSGPIDRKYCLSSLTLYTAGAEGADITIPGLNESMAQRLREFIMNKIKPDEQPRN